MGDFNISALLNKVAERQWDARTLTHESTLLAEQLLNESSRKLRTAEQDLLTVLSKIAEAAKNRDFILKLCDGVLQGSNPDQQCENLKTALSEYGGIPPFFSFFARMRLKAASAISRSMQSAPLKEVKRIIHSTFEELLIPRNLDKAEKRIREWGKEKISVAVSALSPEVFGYATAERYQQHLETILSRQCGAGIVIQPWRLCPEISPYAPEESCRKLAEKLRELLRLSMRGGLSTPVILETGTSELHGIILDAYMKVLAEPEFYRADVMPELPAYLNNTPATLRNLTEWARERAEQGAPPTKILIVKGSHLDDERARTFIYGAECAAAQTKADTDTRFKNLIVTAIQASPEAICPVVGTHNYFDLSYALLQWGRSKRIGLPHFVFRAGLGNHIARYLSREGASVILTAGMEDENDESGGFERHLATIVTELSRPEGYLTNGYAPEVDSMGWTRMRQLYLASLSGRGETEAPSPATADGLVPGTLHKVTDRAYTANFYDQAGREHDKQNLPLLIDGREVTTPLTCIKRSLTAAGVEDYRYTAADFSAVDTIIQLAQEAVLKPLEQEARYTLAHAIARTISQNRTELEVLLMRDAGFTYRDAAHEMLCATDACRYYAETADRSGLRDGTRPAPRGIVVVAPGNIHPLAEAAEGIIAALLTGNAVIYKPMSGNILLGNRLAELITQAGFTAPHFRYIPCPDNQIADKLLTHPEVKVVISGSGARRYTPANSTCSAAIQLKRPESYATAYLAASAKWQQAIHDITESVFRRSGQSPSCPHVLLVHAGIYDNQNFINALRDKLSNIKAAPGWQETAGLGPLAAALTDEAYQLYHQTTGQESWIVAPEQKKSANYIFSPCVRTGIQINSPILTHIHTMPMLALMRVENTEQAIELQQKLSSGKAAIIYSGVEPEIQNWKQALSSCTNLAVNCCPHMRPGLQPFGSQAANPVGGTPVPGGRNFLVYLNRWEENARPQKRGMQSATLFSPADVLTPKPNADDAMRLSTAAASISYWWENEFGLLHEQNVEPNTKHSMQYLPCHVCLRAEEDTSDTELSIALMAALTCTRKGDCRLSLSTAELRPWMTRSLEGLGIRLRAESRSDYLQRLPELAAQHLTVRDSHATDADMEAAAACGLKVVREPIVANGRIELLHYLREQYITEKR